MNAGAQIVSSFVAELRKRGLTVTGSGLSQNVWKVTGMARSRRLDCLVYVKGRGEPPLRWGVTANVVDRLKGQSFPWSVILLHESKDTGYFLSSAEVLRCIRSVWPLGADGDYKPGAGSYLSGATSFSSVAACLALL